MSISMHDLFAITRQYVTDHDSRIIFYNLQVYGRSVLSAFAEYFALIDGSRDDPPHASHPEEP